jgi:hypothetical protein
VTILVPGHFREPSKPLDPSTGLPGNVCCHFLNLTFKEREFFMNARPEQVPVNPEIPVGNDICAYRIFRSSLYRECY